MAQILHLESSPRGDRSVSRQITSEFLAAWTAAHPQDTVVTRDLAAEPPPHVNMGWILGAYGLPGKDSPEAVEAIRTSDALVKEFLAADRYVFGVPMYNFNVPSSFKAYIDNVVRPGITYNSEWKGLVPPGKKMLVVTSRGGAYFPGTPMAAYDQQEPFIRTAFGFIGITDITFVHVQGVNVGRRDEALAESRAQIAELVKTW